MAQLNKRLNTFGLTMIAVGSCIGSGIFITPSITVMNIPHYLYALIPWVLGGLATYLGALTFSELGSRFPKSGGVYVYLREAYGPMVGFLYGWVTLLIINTGAIAALSVAFSNYLNFFIEMTPRQKSLMSIIVISVLSSINVLGVGISQVLTNIFSMSKLVALLFIILIGGYYMFNTDYFSIGSSLIVPPDLGTGILVAFAGVFWSFGGWHHTTYLSGEAINPQRTVPRAMLYGSIIVTLFYLLVIMAYMSLLPIEEMSTSTRVAGDAIANVFSGGGKFVTVAISISIFGTIAIYTMSAPRIYFAMAKDGVFFPRLAQLHAKYKTPHLAIVVQAVWAILLVLIWGSFEELLTFVTFMDILFMALATSSLFIFRSKKLVKPSYQLRAYPLIPIIYLLITCSFVGYALFALRQEALVGLIILVIGIPVFLYFRKS